MKQLLTLAAAILITGTVLTPSFAQDKMGKMDKMHGKMDKMQCAECAKLTKKAGKPTECAACKKMHGAMKAKMSSGNKMSGDKKKM
ncbi:hypothetical protein [Armatimonas sp.]|uniref:hypothetical protein n=1 Tax=Armatimonas sp. TaxID=1872638 RepID=UPI003750C249